jgi:hypothetical protein
MSTSAEGSSVCGGPGISCDIQASTLSSLTSCECCNNSVQTKYDQLGTYGTGAQDMQNRRIVFLAHVDDICEFDYKSASSRGDSTEYEQQLDECTGLHTQRKVPAERLSFLRIKTNKVWLTDTHPLSAPGPTDA